MEGNYNSILVLGFNWVLMINRHGYYSIELSNCVVDLQNLMKGHLLTERSDHHIFFK